VIDYIQKGGLLMWPILACSIISIAVFAERLFYFHRATIHVSEFLKGLSNLIRRRNFAEALHESAGTPGPVARVIHAAIIRHDAPRRELRDIVQEAAQLEVPKLERFLPVLATIAFLTPLLGLLGTVAGMIDAFGTIASSGGYGDGAFRWRLQEFADDCGWARCSNTDICRLQLSFLARKYHDA